MKNYLKVFGIWVLEIVLLVGLGETLRAFDAHGILWQFVVELVIFALFIGVNQRFFKQKILLERYSPMKAWGLLGLSTYELLFTVSVVWRSHLPWTMILTAFGILTVGMTEELVFRGLIFGRLVAMGKSLPFAMIVSSLLFALMHAINLTHQTPLATLVQILYVFPMGMFLAMLYIKSHNLIVPILAHGIQDGMAFLSSAGSLNSTTTSFVGVVHFYVLFGVLVTLYLIFGKKQREGFKLALREEAL